MATVHGISYSRFVKFVMMLSAMGWLETSRGRGGGLRLLKPACQPASEIVPGDGIRHTETDFTLVECFDPAHNTCLLDGHCHLKGALKEAMDAYLTVRDGVRRADFLAPLHAEVQGAQRVHWLPGLPKHMTP